VCPFIQESPANKKLKGKAWTQAGRKPSCRLGPIYGREE